jgi:hypothetical protein
MPTAKPHGIADIAAAVAAALRVSGTARERAAVGAAARSWAMHTPSGAWGGTLPPGIAKLGITSDRRHRAAAAGHQVEAAGEADLK